MYVRKTVQMFNYVCQPVVLEEKETSLPIDASVFTLFFWSHCPNPVFLVSLSNTSWSCLMKKALLGYTKTK